MFVVLIIIIWLIIDFSLGRRIHLRRVKQRETAVLHGELDVFPHGKELFADYFAELRKATKHVHILFYIVKNDQISREFLALLKEKARSGVEVRLLIDRLGSLKVPRREIRELRAAGVRFAYSNPIKFPFLFYSSQVRNHRKITIIDGAVGYLGGFNVGQEYIDEDPVLTPWRDYHLKISGEGTPYLQSVFSLDWQEATGENLFDSSKFFPEQPKGSIRHRFIPTEACGLEQHFLQLIQTATDSIIIGTPYFIPSKALIRELLAVLQRGISVTILVPSNPDHILVQEASYRYFRRLLRAGAHVYQLKYGFYHAKTMIIDKKICDVGTANFDKRSLFLNKELNCYIYDPKFIERVRDVLEHDLNDSKQLSLKDLQKFNPWRTVKEAIAALLSYFL